MLDRLKIALLAAAAALFAVVAWLALADSEAVPLAPDATPTAAASPQVDRPEPEPTNERTERSGTTRAAVHGRVLDEDDLPIAGVELRFTRVFAPSEHHTTKSGTGGHFVIQHIETAGSFEVSLPHPFESILGSTRQKAETPRIAELIGTYQVVDLPIDGLVIRARRLPTPNTVRGFVHDPDGNPIEGATINVLYGGRTSQPITSDAAGEFVVTEQASRAAGEFVVIEPAPNSKVVGLQVDAAGFVGVDRSAIPFGPEIQDFELQPAHHVRVRVLEAGSGRAVENFAIRVKPKAARRIDIDEPRNSGTHPEGIAAVDGLWSGINSIVAVPDDPTLTRSDLVEVDPDRIGDQPVDLIVHRLAPLRARVTWNGNNPAANLRVLLIDTRARKLPRNVHDTDTRPLTAESRWLRRAPHVVSRSHTDDDGFATLGLPNKVRRLFLRIELPNGKHVDRLLGNVTGGMIEVRLDREEQGVARLSGVVKHSWGQQARFTLNIDERRVEWLQGNSFDVQGLKTGKRRVKLAMLAPKRRTVRITTIKLDAGDHRELALQCPSPGSITGTVTIDGKPATGTVGLYTRGNGVLKLGATELSADGSYTLENLWPESVLLRLEPTADRDSALWNPRGAVAVKSDRVTDGDMHFSRRAVIFRVRDEHGSPCVNRRLCASCGPIAQWAPTDEHGHAVVEGVPIRGTIRLWLTHRQQHEIAAVEMVPTRALYEVDAVLSEPSTAPSTDEHVDVIDGIRSLRGDLELLRESK